MKRGILVFLRVIFILFVIVGVSIYMVRSYSLYESKKAIEQALIVGEMPVIGDGSSPFSIIEFYDYRCPHCAAMSRAVDTAIEGDTQTKIILRPVVLSDQDSFRIAAFVLSADKEKAGATVALHRQIMALGDIPTFDTVKAIAQSMGLNPEKIEQQAAMDEGLKTKIATNTKLVRDIGFYGVPALVIGDKGYVSRNGPPGVNELRLMILDAKTRLQIQK